MSDINLNKTALACPACSKECEKINERINKRKMYQIKTKEVPHILKVFNF